MNPRILLIGSLVCNLGLAGAAYTVFKKQEPIARLTSLLPAKQAATPQEANATPSMPTREIASTTPTDSFEKFACQSLQSKDFRTYIDRLRAVDCPEETIRDIITAEVNKIYAKRIRNIREANRTETKYWETKRNYWNPRKNYELQKQIRAAEKERSALLIELLGVDPNEELRKENNYVDFWERGFQFLPEDKRDQVAEIQVKYQEQEQEIYQRRGFTDEEDQKKIRELYKKRLEELSAILSPEELRQYDLTSSQVSNQLRYELDSFNPSEDEFKKIFDIRKAHQDDLAYNYDPDDKEAAKRRETVQKETDEQIKQTIGEDRFKLYKLSSDWNYKELVRIVDRQELPRENAIKVYDLKKEAEDAANQVRANNDYTQAQKNEILKKLREETEKGITGALGEKGWKRYNDRQGWWLNNISPRNRQ